MYKVKSALYEYLIFIIIIYCTLIVAFNVYFCIIDIIYLKSADFRTELSLTSILISQFIISSCP